VNGMKKERESKIGLERKRGNEIGKENFDYRISSGWKWDEE